MNRLKSNNFNGITEFKNELKSSDIKIWIYTLPVKDLDKKHRENYDNIKFLKKENKDILIIEFNENLIGSFDEIKNWGEIKYTKSEYRNIQTNILTERKLLERMLLQEIRQSSDKSKYEIINNEKNCVYIKQALLNKDNIILKRKINFDVNIKEDENIIVGFDLSHSYDYINTLAEELNVVKPGDKVKDYYNHIVYEFVSVADFSISDVNEYMQCSIIDYYKNKNQSYIVDKLNPKTKAVLVSKNKNIFPYIPNRLKRVCDYGNLESRILKECSEHTKLSAHKKMKLSIDITEDVLVNSQYTKFNKKNMLIENLGYKKHTLPKPRFIFGNSKKHSSILYGLPENGSYENREINIMYFIDPNILKNKSKYDKMLKFSLNLEQFSKDMGVVLNRQKSNVSFKSINIDNKDKFECDIRRIVDNYKNPVIVIMDDENCEKYYSSIKKIFGNKHNIATQFISFSTLNYNEKNKNAVLLNILLGIYGKSGIQPWILDGQLTADCYIGLDVSRENKLSTAGIIQIVGKDGRILKSKSLTSPQSGEKINTDTIREIFYEAVASYEKIYNEYPKHIVIHRDGISREELDILKETAKNLDIKFEYVEITKNVNRRIATFKTSDGLWETEMGSYYAKENFAYIVTTNPYEKIGMAKPLRIKRVHGEQSMDKIVEDVYKLSFMHIGSILKSRLPVTTHYADLSSTYGNRELIPNNIDSNALHFI
ncbi:MAG: Piwi domain-containing protein [Terrisporobacter sp.]|uniref:Piwi domain-containing protein n=1 Tax=Terrisporobacter sp. TaxID=1965305 RepID=UPI0039A3E5D6